MTLLSLRLDLPGLLLDLDDHELRRFERREGDQDVHDALIDVVLRGGFLVALHEIRIAWGRALERTLSKQVVHEGADVQSKLGPERLVVRLEHRPLEIGRASCRERVEK